MFKLTKNKIITYLSFAAILFIAAFLRFNKLGYSPNGIYVDEASIGYNAYSILKTGKDEFGMPFPAIFRSFADFKTPVYIYLSTIAIYFFGLTPFSVRFVSAVAGVGSVFIIFFLVRLLLGDNKFSKDNELRSHADLIALITSFVMAISPWSVMMSRSAFETNLALFLFLMGIYFLYLSFRKPYTLILSAVFFSLSLLSYHAERIIVPLFLLICCLRYRNYIFPKNKLYAIISVLFGILIVLPTIPVIFTPGFLIRAGGLSIFNLKNQFPAGYIPGLTSLAGTFANFIPFLSIKEFLALYLSYFSPRNLFFLGDPDPRISFPGLAAFFIWEFPFFIYGFYRLIGSKTSKEFAFLTYLLLLITPIPAALTRDPFTTIRSLPFVVPASFIVSIGIYNTFQFIFKKTSYFRYFLAGIFILAAISYSILKFISSIILLDFYRAKDWQYGFEQLTETVKSLQPGVPVIVDNARVESYSELLFYMKFDPKKYQQDNTEVALADYYNDLSRNKTKIIGNIITRNIDWEQDTHSAEYLIGDSLAISDDQILKNHLTLIKKITYPDISVAFVIVKTNP